MSLEICQQHNLIKDYICSTGENSRLMCRKCFLSNVSSGSQGVKLSFESKEFFLKWTEFVLRRIVEFRDVVTHMGYSKVFELKLQPSHPKGSVNELNFQDIEKAAIEALQEHRKITEGNLIFIQGTTTIGEMMHPQFLKDLYNIVCEDAKFNLTNLVTGINKRLIAAYPQKEIYKYATFHILPKQLGAMEGQRRVMLGQYEERIVLKVGGEKYIGKVTDKEFSKDYLSPSHHSTVPLLDTNVGNTVSSQQVLSPIQPNNMSTVSNPSMTINEVKQVDYTQRDISDTISEMNSEKPSYQKLTTTIAFLRENELMYQEKIVKLEQQNVVLKSEIERLGGVESKVKQLERRLIQSEMEKSAKENILPEISSQLQASLNAQIEQLQNAQALLVQENAKINRGLKDLQDIAEGRSRTISSLQEQIKSLTSNLQLKQKSIQQLSMLISNEQEEIAYRQNQVEILGGEIKKKLQRIEFLEKSIHELNNLVSNQEEEISYRENEVQTLTEEVKKLLGRIAELEKSVKSLNVLISNEEQELAYRENETQILQEEIKKLMDKVKYLEKSIHQLNNLIANEEQEIAYRENQTLTLTQEVKKLVDSNKELGQKLEELQRKNSEFQRKAQELKNNGEVGEKCRLLQTELNLINEQNIQLTEEVKLNKEKYSFIEEQLKAQVQKSTGLEIQLKSIKQNYTLLQTEVKLLKQQLVNVKAELNLTREEKIKLEGKLKEMSPEQKVNEEMMRQLVLLEADLQNKTHDIKILYNLIQECMGMIEGERKQYIVERLGELRTAKVELR